ncbi:MAG: exopolysaccharide biosynthesis polyprenyl glycosylphosphotransferase [Clostridia bacterium]|nr:exopolysaccharide biosynthesis polyprenyl glycosylphosphotransferase [Clostridia bacterium]
MSRYRALIIDLFKIMLIVITLVQYAVAIQLCYPNMLGHMSSTVLLYGLYLILLLVFSKTYECFAVGEARIRELIFSFALTLVFTNGITYLQLSLILGYMASALMIMGLTAAQILVGVVIDCGMTKVYITLYPPLRMAAVVNDDRASRSVLRRFNRIVDRFAICETVVQSDDFETLTAAIDRNEGVILCGVELSLRSRLIEYCNVHDKKLYIVPVVSDIMINAARRTQVDDLLVYARRNADLTKEELVVKRLVDIIVSLLMLVCLSPLMLITALCIYLYDRGPVLFYQQRVTKGGKLFKIIKFRSMVVDAERDGKPRPAVDNDPRITPVGRFIRATRIDELPQLFNILKGDMSLVGPRPERYEYLQPFMEQDPLYALRLKVKTGLTGYAQVMGKYNTTMHDKLILDLMYIENYSLSLDFKLMFLTLRVLFFKRSTEGFDKREEE